MCLLSPMAGLQAGHSELAAAPPQIRKIAERDGWGGGVGLGVAARASVRGGWEIESPTFPAKISRDLRMAGLQHGHSGRTTDLQVGGSEIESPTFPAKISRDLRMAAWSHGHSGPTTV